jgi:hypothetical protein
MFVFQILSEQSPSTVQLPARKRLATADDGRLVVSKLFEGHMLVAHARVEPGQGERLWKKGSVNNTATWYSLFCDTK